LQRAAAIGSRAKMAAEVERRVTRFEPVRRCDALFLPYDPRDIGFVEAIVEKLRILKFPLGLTYQVIDLVRRHAGDSVLYLLHSAGYDG
jgi:hypothetical protein